MLNSTSSEEYHRAKVDAFAMVERLDGREPTERESKEIQSAINRAKDLKRQDAFMAALDKQTAGMVHDAREVRGSGIGAQFMRASADWLRDKRNRGSRWETPMLELPDPRGFGGGGELHATTITTTPTAGGTLVVPQYLPGIAQIPLRPPVVSDLIPNAPTPSNSIIYDKETAISNAAAAVAEGAAKPEGAIVLAPVTEPVIKTAWYLPVTDEFLEDIPSASAYIDSRLMAGLQEKEDAELLNGSGVAPDLLGLLNRPGLAPPLARVDPDTNMDVIAKQISAIESANPGFVVTGIVMHPANYLASRLTKTTFGDYVGAGPWDAVLRPQLWGKLVAQTTQIAAGTALVLCGSAAMIFRRTGILVAATNSHQDWFTKNITCVRAEERFALAVFREAALGIVTALT
jgi:HK97 family phage major capsid protein